MRKEFLQYPLLACAAFVVGCSTPKPPHTRHPLPPLSTMLPSSQTITGTDAAAQETIVSAPKKRLLTLREQMQRLEDKQSAGDGKIDSALREISSVRKDVELLKNTISETAQPRSTAKAGKAIIAPDPDEDEILPDDIIDKPVSKKTPAFAPKSRKFTETKSKPIKKIIPNKESSSENLADEIKPDEKTKILTESKPDSTKVKPGSQYHKALNLISKKQYDEASTLLLEILKTEKSPEVLSNSYYWLGESYFGISKYDQAIFNFQKVIRYKNSSKLDDAQLMVAESYQRLGRNDEAKKSFQKLVDFFPTSEFVPRAKKMLQKL
ncbi:MAG: tetratricopeptide repeat protein [Ignavibacteria bacterium]|nr:tetratricopeptide repeat protein [Ignavibacteria bacterium]